MKQNKLVLFDWGNIVESHTTDYNCYDAFNKLFELCGYKGEGNGFDLVHEFKLSRIRTEDEFREVYERMKVKFDFNTTYEEFVKNYKEAFDPIAYYPEVADYEHSLSDKCYIGILSNLLIFDKERLDKQVNLSLYDYVFLSFEIGLKKPSKEIYEYVEQHVPFKKEDILFIDDREDNINMAKEMGWNTLHATGLELPRIKSGIEEFLKVHD